MTYPLGLVEYRTRQTEARTDAECGIPEQKRILREYLERARVRELHFVYNRLWSWSLKF